MNFKTSCLIITATLSSISTHTSVRLLRSAALHHKRAIKTRSAHAQKRFTHNQKAQCAGLVLGATTFVIYSQLQQSTQFDNSSNIRPNNESKFNKLWRYFKRGVSAGSTVATTDQIIDKMAPVCRKTVISYVKKHGKDAIDVILKAANDHPYVAAGTAGMTIIGGLVYIQSDKQTRLQQEALLLAQKQAEHRAFILQLLENI